MVDVPFRQPPAVFVRKIEDAADGGVGRHGDAVVGRHKPRRHAENPPHRAAVGDDEERLARIFAGGGGEEVFDALLEDFACLAARHVGHDIFVRESVDDFRICLLDLRLVVAFENAAVPFAEVVDVVDWRVRMEFCGDFRSLDRALQITAVDGVDMSVFQILGGAFDLPDAIFVQRTFIPALEDSGLVGFRFSMAQKDKTCGFHIDSVLLSIGKREKKQQNNLSYGKKSAMFCGVYFAVGGHGID